MSLVNAGHSEIQPPPLLKLIGKGNHTTVAQLWAELTLPWNAKRAYEKFCRGIERYREQYPKLAADESEAKRAEDMETTALHQLREILVYSSEKLPLKNEKTQLLDSAVRDFEGNYDPTIKDHDTEERLHQANWIMKAICYHHPKIAFERCPNSRSGNQNNFLPSAFHFAVSTKSEHILQVILDELMASFERDNITYSEHQSQANQPQEVDCNDKTAVEKNMMEVLELVLMSFASLPQGIQIKVTNILKIMVSKNTSLLNESTWKTAVTTLSPDLVRCLFESGDSMFLTEAHAAFVVEKGTAQIWNTFPENSRRKFISKPNCTFLHKAISLGKVDMVEELLKLEPTLIERYVSEDGYEYPSQHLKKLKENTSLDEKGKAYEAIRDLLVHAMIRSHNLGLQNIRDILEKSDGMWTMSPPPFPPISSLTNKWVLIYTVEGE